MFLWTVGDHWGPLLPVFDRCDTDPVRTEGRTTVLIYREPGKLPRTTRHRRIVQVSGCGQWPLLIMMTTFDCPMMTLARVLEANGGSVSRFCSEPTQTLRSDSTRSIKGGLPKALSESLY